MKHPLKTISRVFWRGTINDIDVCAVASIGGNAKTGNVFELSLIPTQVIELFPEAIKDIAAHQQGAVYVRLMRELDLYLGVCPGTCALLLSGKCYVQYNIRNAGQVARIIRNIETIPEPGFHRDVLGNAVAMAANWFDVRKVRSMVVGDAAMLPMMVWVHVMRSIRVKFSAAEFLGYTHAWEDAPWLRPTHVASVDSAEEGGRAWAAGWSTFEGHTAVVETMPQGAVLCPGTKEFERKNEFAFTCNNCPVACNGQGKPKRRIAPRHGNGDASTKAAAGRRGITLTDSKGRVRGLYQATA